MISGDVTISGFFTCSFRRSAVGPAQILSLSLCHMFLPLSPVESF